MILDFFDDLNWVAVLVAWLAAFAIGSVWYAPPVLGNRWAGYVTGFTRMSKEELAAGSMAAALPKWLVGMAVNAIALALALEAMGADSVGDGIVAGLVLGIGLGATLMSWPVIFARMPLGLWAINTGAFLAMQVAMGAILGAWN
ncbi:MAG: DUF1761 domain-containing protein [Gaiellaceae bacterium]